MITSNKQATDWGIYGLYREAMRNVAVLFVTPHIN